MIFVTLGTQDKSFKRLLEAIDKAIDEGYIKDKVIVQAGVTKYTSDNMEIYNLLSMDKFNNYIKSCDLLITHGGVGSILTGLNNNKKVIATARLKCFDEHESNHQVQIINEFEKLGYILKLDDLDNMGIVLKKSKKFKPKPFKSNNTNFVKMIDDMIKEFK